MKLDDLLTAIEAHEKTLALDLDAYPPSVRPGLEMSKNQAVDHLADAKKAYSTEVKSRALVFLLDGPSEKQAEFADIAKHEAEALVVDAAELYRKVAEQSMPLLEKGRLSASNIPEVVGILRDVVRGLGVRSMPMIDLDHDLFVGNPGILEEAVRASVRRVVDDDLNKMYLEHSLIEQALSSGYNGDVVGVIVTNATKPEQEVLAKTFCSGKGLVVQVPENVTKEEVVKTLIQKKPKAKKSNQ